MSAAGPPQGTRPSGGAARSARTAFVALTATLAIQIFTSLAATAPAVLAPELGREFGVNPRWIGVFVGLVYLGAMIASLACIAFIERYGAIRVSQVCVLLCAAGIILVGMLPTSAAALLVGAAILIGLGYGPITPASSQVLARTTPPSQMALMFSIKQTGVPAGAALAGALLPAAALSFGWRAAAVLVGLIGLAVAVMAQSTRRSLDTDLQHRGPKALASIAARLRLVARTPALAELALLSFAYASVQVCLTSFLVVYLHDALQWSLVAAGLALTFATVGGVIGRIAWGALADQVLAPRRVLSLIGLIAGVCSLTMAFSTPAWPAAIMLPLVAVFGGTAIGWNGVQLSELARLAPPGSAGAVTGAAGFITFSGVVTGPPLFAALAAMTSGFRTGYLVFAAVSIVAAAALHLRPRPR
jgi:MFS family permease